MDEITVVDVEPQLVIGMRKRGPYPEIGNMIKELFEFAMGRNIQLMGPPMFVCHETPEGAIKANEEGNADIEVVIPVAEKIEDTDEVKCYALPGGKMAKTVHKGPYEDCGLTYEKLFLWLGENGKEIVGPTREAYLNDPHEVPPEDILTEIYAPID